MGRQRNIPQVKKQDKSTEKELNEMQASNLPDTEFKMVVIKIFKELRRRINELRMSTKRW